MDHHVDGIPVLESSILSDPLISTHAPTLTRTLFLGTKTTGRKRTRSTTTSTPSTQALSSAHVTNLKHLTYLALVNYADLLSSCSDTFSRVGGCQGGNDVYADIVRKVSFLHSLGRRVNWSFNVSS